MIVEPSATSTPGGACRTSPTRTTTVRSSTVRSATVDALASSTVPVKTNCDSASRSLTVGAITRSVGSRRNAARASVNETPADTATRGMSMSRYSQPASNSPLTSVAAMPSPTDNSTPTHRRRDGRSPATTIPSTTPLTTGNNSSHPDGLQGLADQ